MLFAGQKGQIYKLSTGREAKRRLLVDLFFYCDTRFARKQSTWSRRSAVINAPFFRCLSFIKPFVVVVKSIRVIDGGLKFVSVV